MFFPTNRLVSRFSMTSLSWLWLFISLVVIPGYCCSYVMQAVTWNSGWRNLIFDWVVSSMGALNLCVAVFFASRFSGAVKWFLIAMLWLMCWALVIYWLIVLVMFKFTGGYFVASAGHLQMPVDQYGRLIQSALHGLLSWERFLAIFCLMSTPLCLMCIVKHSEATGWLQRGLAGGLLLSSLAISCTLVAYDRIRNEEAYLWDEAFAQVWNPLPGSSFLLLRGRPFPINVVSIARHRVIHGACYNKDQIVGAGKSPQIRPSADFAGPIERGVSLISIQLESINHMASFAAYSDDNYMMPHLHSWIEASGVNYRNNGFFAAIASGGTSDAEFAQLCGLDPSRTTASFYRIHELQVQCLPKVLKSHGFKTVAVHANHSNMYNRSEAYPILGFDRMMSAAELIPHVEAKSSSSSWPADGKILQHAFANLTDSPMENEFLHFVGLESHAPYREINLGDDGTIPFIYLQKCPSCVPAVVAGFAQAARAVDEGVFASMEFLKRKSLQNGRRYIVYIYGDHAPPLRTNLFRDAEDLGRKVERIQTRDQRIPYVALQVAAGKMTVLPASPHVLSGFYNQADIVTILSWQLAASSEPWARSFGALLEKQFKPRRTLNPNYTLVYNYMIDRENEIPLTQDVLGWLDVVQTEQAFGCAHM